MAGRVYVAGSANMDIVARAPRLPQPGATVLATALHKLPGGKGANQAIAAAKAGSSVTFFGCLGQDAFGDELAGFLSSAGIDLTHLARVPIGSGTALITVDDSGQNQIAVFPGANAALPFCDSFRAAKPGDVLLCQNECPLDVVLEYARAARGQGVRVLHNAAPAVAISKQLLEIVDVLIVNDEEAFGCFIGLNPSAEAPRGAIAMARALQRRDDQIVIVTLGADGLAALAGERTIRLPAHRVQVVDTTGAGDCFCGYLASCLAEGAAIDRAVAVANAAAALAVQKIGAGVSMPPRAEVEAFLQSVHSV